MAYENVETNNFAYALQMAYQSKGSARRDDIWDAFDELIEAGVEPDAVSFGDLMEAEFMVRRGLPKSDTVGRVLESVKHRSAFLKMANRSVNAHLDGACSFPASVTEEPNRKETTSALLDELISNALKLSGQFGAGIDADLSARQQEVRSEIERRAK